MSAKKLSKPTIASYLNTVMAGLRWAETIWPDFHAPAVQRVRVSGRKLMRGRPITREEFDRMIAATAAVVGRRYAGPWRQLLRAMFHGGLRLGEALRLSWDEPDKMHVFNLDTRRPMLKIWENTQKGHQDQLYPITPEFARLLRSRSPDKRTGAVFVVRARSRRIIRVDVASKIVARIGRAANIVVNRHAGVPEYATAHDLRRSFGDQWATRLPTIRLMQLMRHKSLDTTMRYYVREDANAASAEIWEASKMPSGGKTSGKYRKRPGSAKKGNA